jgi:hypothetical protein
MFKRLVAAQNFAFHRAFAAAIVGATVAQVIMPSALAASSASASVAAGAGDSGRVAGASMGASLGSGGDSSAGTSGPDNSLPSSADRPHAGDVQQILAHADAYKQYGTTNQDDLGRKLIFPPGDCAVDLYRRVLAVDPGNQQAKQGLRDIAAFYTGYAQKKCDQSQYDACKVQAQDGLLADPDNTTLKKLLKQADDGLHAVPSSH